MKEQNKRRIKIILTILKFLLLIFIIVGIPLLVYFNNPEILENFDSLESVNAFLEQYKTGSIFIYIGIQIFQIVVSIIPGQAIQFAAGYAFEFWLGYLLSIVGIALGTVLTFYIARILGRDFVHLVFGEERIQRYVDRLNSKKGLIIIFILYLIPGVPKDMLTYAAGVSDLKFIPFLVINLVARTPALMATILIGSFFRSHSYTGMIVIAVAAVILFIIGILNREKLIKKIDLLYNKTVKKDEPSPNN